MVVPTLSSRVTAVTVFRRGAMVTRTATLERGRDEGFPAAVRIEGLPLLLDDASLRVAVDADGPGEVPVARDLRVTLAVPAPDEDLRPPTNEQLEAATLAYATAKLHAEDLEGEAARVAALAPGARGAPEDGTPPIASPTAARLALLDFRRQRLEALDQRVLEAAEATREAKERLDTLRERERRASKARNARTFETRKAVVVGLLAVAEEPAARVELTLRYFVPGARWAPSYVLRLRPGYDGGTLELRALVGQATGERWTNVALTLSTANPQQWTELPRLRSMRIGRQQPPPARTGWRPPPGGADLLYADFDRAVPPVPPPPQPVSRPAPRPAALGAVAGAARAVALGGMRAEESLAMPMAPAQAAPEPELARSSRARRAPPPPPMPQAAPAKKQKASLVPRSGGPSAPAFDREEMDDEADGYGGAGGGGVPLASAAATLVADRSLLDYGALVVAGAEQPGRGTLQRSSPAERYGQLSELPSDRIAAALSEAGRARRRAQALESRAAPGQHRWAHAVDGFDYAYAATATIDLDSDGRMHGVAVLAPQVSSQPRYITVPRESQDVFRVLQLPNPLDAPLLPGPVDVYVGGRFALASLVPQTPPGGRVELGLGVEQAIKIARNVAFDDESSGLLKRHRELEHRIRIEIANNLPAEATVEVRERVPVTAADEDDITVVERHIDPAWDELEVDERPLRGGRKWVVTVPAGAKTELSATWSIRIPNSQELVGGNRREG
ncbi:MAG: DUF4139 domain-containing protein [Nannocystaceae bacterium]